MPTDHLRAYRRIISLLVLSALLPGCESATEPPEAVSTPVVASVTVSSLQGTPAVTSAQGDGASLPDLAVSWADIEGGRAAKAARASLGFSVQNRGATARKVEVRVVSPTPDGKSVERVLGTWMLEAGQKGESAVQVSQLPLQTIDASSQVILHARDAAASADQKLDVFSEPLSIDFTDETYQQADVYDEKTRSVELSGGKRPAWGTQFHGRVWQAEGFIPLEKAMSPTMPDSFIPLVPGIWRDVPPEEVNAPIPAASQGDAVRGDCVPRSVRFCAQWWADYVDIGEEDYLTTSGTSPARYASYQVAGPNGFISSGQFLDGTGCTQTFLACAGYYDISVTSRMRLGQTDVWVKRCASPSSCGTPTVGGADWLGVNMPAGGPTTATLQPPGTNQISRASVVVAQLGWSQDMALPAGGVLTVLVNAGITQTGSTISNIGKSTVAPFQDDSYWKYIIAHELGHAAHQASYGYLQTNYSAGDSTLDICKCTKQIPAGDWDGPEHCMESQETTTSAQAEGMAHFFATRLFNYWANPNPKFNYYKKTCNPDAGSACTTTTYPAISPPRPYIANEGVKWLETRCGGPAARGNERDWSAFYWRWNNQSPGYSYMTEIYDVYRQACGGSACNSSVVSWGQLDTSAKTYFGVTSPKYARFANASAEAGVRH